MNRKDRRSAKRDEKKKRQASRLRTEATLAKHDKPGHWHCTITEIGEDKPTRDGIANLAGLRWAIKLVEGMLPDVTPGMYMLEFISPTGKHWRKCWSTWKGHVSREAADEYLKEKRRASAHTVDRKAAQVAEGTPATSGARGSD